MSSQIPWLKNRHFLLRGWVVISLCWSVIRSLGVRHIFGPHGTNAAIYLAIDLVCTVPFAIYSGKAVFAWRDKSPQLIRYAAISSVAFFMPDLFVIATAKRVPTEIWDLFAIYLAFAVAITLYRLVKSD